ncbi:hypothetical protein DSLASN_31400 [Desulfoluna limicola]|uniref:Uncharacterized protein n=1 Tax=Desulfoluna limicola TaxID=2810562 RepID=A0ABN6F553_9BACT|nr:hypothetical protein DSLASN_31400 [Desulfoluna limicola]
MRFSFESHGGTFFLFTLFMQRLNDLDPAGRHKLNSNGLVCGLEQAFTGTSAVLKLKRARFTDVNRALFFADQGSEVFIL